MPSSGRDERSPGRPVSDPVLADGAELTLRLARHKGNGAAVAHELGVSRWAVTRARRRLGLEPGAAGRPRAAADVLGDPDRLRRLRQPVPTSVRPVKQIAERLSVSERTVYRALQQPGLTGLRPGGS